MSIDSFRALDTTHIFAARTARADSLESRLMNTFPPDYLVNRIGAASRMGYACSSSKLRSNGVNSPPHTPARPRPMARGSYADLRRKMSRFP